MIEDIKAKWKEATKGIRSIIRECLIEKNCQDLTDEEIYLYVDPCNNSGYLYWFQVGTVRLNGETIEIFKSGLDIENVDYDDLSPDNYWNSHGDWYAEWEGLIDIAEALERRTFAAKEKTV